MLEEADGISQQGLRFVKVVFFQEHSSERVECGGLHCFVRDLGFADRNCMGSFDLQPTLAGEHLFWREGGGQCRFDETVISRPCQL